MNLRTSSTRYKRALPVAARKAVQAGWPVVPGAWWSPMAHRHVCDVYGCKVRGLHPASQALHDTGPAGPVCTQVAAISDMAQVEHLWSEHPYAVLVATGVVCDVIDCPVDLGRELLQGTAASGLTGPVVATGARTLIFCRPGEPVTERQVVALRADGVLVHQTESWVPLPPTLAVGQSVRWDRRPGFGSWAMPALAPALRYIDHLHGRRGAAGEARQARRSLARGCRFE